MIFRNAFHNTVSQAHAPGNAGNIHAINTYRIKNIILTRNIFDAVVSLVDHIEHERRTHHIACTDPSYYSLSETEKADFVIEMMVPWYVTFYVSWYMATENKQVDALWMTYEDLIDNEGEFWERVGEFCGQKIDHGTFTTQGLRFNVGKVGRGERLTDNQKDAIIGYARFYPEIDFTRMGIGPSLTVRYGCAPLAR